MTTALQIDNLVKTYKNGVQALNGVSFSVNQGDFFALLGPNGAGKSTLISIVSSLVNKTSGKVKVFDVDTDDNFSLAKQYLGIVPQEFNFYTYEPLVEILMNQAGYYGVPRKLARERSEYYLERVGLFGKRHDSPMLLSGGMKRRLMIARSLVHGPRLLILDEPTAGVDIEIRHSMWEFINELNSHGMTVILTTHYLEEAEHLCRNIAIINKGNIVEYSSVKQLLQKLEKEFFILDLKTAIDDSISLENFEVRFVDDQCLEVVINKTQSINDVFALLSEKGIEVRSMRNKANRLESLFLDLIKSSN